MVDYANIKQGKSFEEMEKEIDEIALAPAHFSKIAEIEKAISEICDDVTMLNSYSLKWSDLREIALIHKSDNCDIVNIIRDKNGSATGFSPKNNKSITVGTSVK